MNTYNGKTYRGTFVKPHEIKTLTFLTEENELQNVDVYFMTYKQCLKDFSIKKNNFFLWGQKKLVKLIKINNKDINKINFK